MNAKKIDPAKLGFGIHFTDHMYVIKYHEDKGWYDGGIVDYRPFQMSPASSVLHYSQEIFEGLKAYKTPDQRVLAFRPEMNARRMNRSAREICMPELPEDIFLEAVRSLVMKDREWIPDAPGTSLYIRPTMLGVEAFLGVRPAKEYMFYIILSPVGPYYSCGFTPVGIYVEDTLVRAAKGGTGDIKTGGNYAASLLGQMKAQEKGFPQVLWLDAKEHRYVEEVGSMNVFFVYGKTLVTPPLTGSILPGITRDSVLTLAEDMGYGVEERALEINGLLEDVLSGRVTESFGTGTAAVISPMGSLFYKEKNYVINNNQVGEVTQKLYDRLVGIQIGREPDPYGWVCELGKMDGQ